MSRSLLNVQIVVRYAPNKDGYVLVRLDNGQVDLEQRVVMAKALKRELEPHEIVRHLNDDRADNSISNLMLDERGEGRPTHCVSLVCAGCQTPFSRALKTVALSLKRGQKQFYCSHQCVGRAHGRKKKEQQ